MGVNIDHLRIMQKTLIPVRLDLDMSERMNHGWRSAKVNGS